VCSLFKTTFLKLVLLSSSDGREKPWFVQGHSSTTAQHSTILQSHLKTEVQVFPNLGHFNSAECFNLGDLGRHYMNVLGRGI
jgi:hypothetical protein